MSGASGTVWCGEDADQVGPDVDQGVVVVKEDDQAGGGAVDDLGLLVQSGWCRPEDRVDRDLLDSALVGDGGAVGVAPGVVGGGHGGRHLSVGGWERVRGSVTGGQFRTRGTARRDVGAHLGTAPLAGLPCGDFARAPTG